MDLHTSVQLRLNSHKASVGEVLPCSCLLSHFSSGYIHFCSQVLWSTIYTVVNFIFLQAHREKFISSSLPDKPFKSLVQLYGFIKGYVVRNCKPSTSLMRIILDSLTGKWSFSYLMVVFLNRSSGSKACPIYDGTCLSLKKIYCMTYAGS